MKKKSTEIFENAPIPKAVFLNIIPSIVSMLMVLVYNLADTFFIGQTKNALMVAAVSQATPAFLLFMAIGMLFGIGGTSLISRLLGQGRKAEARKACSFCFWTGLGVGVVGMLAILIFNEPISWLVGATESTIEYVRQYLVIVAFGVPFLIIGNVFSNVIRAEGSANKAMMGMILGNLTNIVLDPIMILTFGWNVARFTEEEANQHTSKYNNYDYFNPPYHPKQRIYVLSIQNKHLFVLKFLEYL